eukprot:CAMPEP_0170128160 /NCGR_PEP_ID=MMETSP0020_2-20130122/20984_1 /TAXON_ID=98059 /ORGANISM="Dinobryon sp., Strain UTEXLB2267" /LENGTH=252 /DNA_ID=CAMNT_0010361985 /DNA_START=330 /DNA_END=1085 /DNA_ORIENTATION=+
MSAAFTWRFALAFGSVPPLLAFPWRLRMHETETFERVKKERQDSASIRSNSLKYTVPLQNPPSNKSSNSHTFFASKPQPISHFAKSRNIVNMITEDIDNNALNNTTTTNATNNNFPYNSVSHMLNSVSDHNNSISNVDTSNEYSLENSIGNLSNVSLISNAKSSIKKHPNELFSDNNGSKLSSGGRWEELTKAFYGIPGYWLSIVFIDRVGRKNLQLMGFSAMAVLFAVCSVYYDWMLEEGEGVGPHRKYLF